MALGSTVMLLGAPFPHLGYKVIESLVLELTCILIDAVGAFLPWLMRALFLDVLGVFFGDSKAVDTLLAGGMLAPSLLVLLVGHHLGFVMDLLGAFWLRRRVDHLLI